MITDLYEIWHGFVVAQNARVGSILTPIGTWAAEGQMITTLFLSVVPIMDHNSSYVRRISIISVTAP